MKRDEKSFFGTVLELVEIQAGGKHRGWRVRLDCPLRGGVVEVDIKGDCPSVGSRAWITGVERTA
jgi:hypothetical protein